MQPDPEERRVLTALWGFVAVCYLAAFQWWLTR